MKIIIFICYVFQIILIEKIICEMCGLKYLKKPKKILVNQGINDKSRYLKSKQENWENIRIHLDFSPIENNIGKFDKNDLINLRDHIMVKAKNALEKLIKVRPIESNLRLTGDMCDEVPIPDFYKQKEGGVQADLVIFVALDDTGFYKANKIEAAATYCAQDDLTRRPVAGFINFRPGINISNSTSLDYMTWLALHEMTHIFVFNDSLYEDFVDENLLPFNLHEIVGTKVLTNNKKMNYLKTKNVLEKGKKHFNCSDLEGVPLEFMGGVGTSGSHWSKKIMNTDYMIGDSYGENLISEITLALFEDSGWYKVNYDLANLFLWGKNKGCGFLDFGKKCIREKSPEQNKNKNEEKNEKKDKQIVEIDKSINNNNDEKKIEEKNNDEKENKGNKDKKEENQDKMDEKNEHKEHKEHKKHKVHKEHKEERENKEEKVNRNEADFLSISKESKLEDRLTTTNNNFNSTQNTTNRIKDISVKSKNHLVFKLLDYETDYNDEFCTKLNYPVCSTSHIFRGICKVRRYKTPLSIYETYFKDNSIGGVNNLVSKCPIATEDKILNIFYSGSCRIGLPRPGQLSIEKICPECSCFMSNLIPSKKEKDSSFRNIRKISQVDLSLSAESKIINQESKAKINNSNLKENPNRSLNKALENENLSDEEDENEYENSDGSNQTFNRVELQNNSGIKNNGKPNKDLIPILTDEDYKAMCFEFKCINQKLFVLIEGKKYECNNKKMEISGYTGNIICPPSEVLCDAKYLCKYGCTEKV